MPDYIAPTRSHGLVDILDRVLDKGLVIAGDIKINLANVELLTIQIRLVVCSIDKAQQVGLNWWQNDPRMSSGTGTLSAGTDERLRKIEQQLERLVHSTGGSGVEPSKRKGGK